MALFDSYNESESPYVRVGDGGFIGMDYRTAPDKLKEGVYSYGENVRTRTKEAVTRPGNPYINWFYPDNYPWDIECVNNALTGSWSNSSIDTTITVDSGTTSGTPFAHGFDHIRFESGLILKATGEESAGEIPVEAQFVANGQDTIAETFVWCKQVLGDINSPTSVDMSRSVISIASPAQSIVATGEFRDPNSKDYAVIVTDTSTWFGSEYSRPFEVTIPGGVDNNAYLLQAFDRLLLFRGTGQPVLEYTNASGVWSSITGVDSVGYTLPIPNADRAVFFQNRIWLHVNDNVYFSDIGNYTHYYWLENEVRINSGENDKIVALFPYGKHSLLVFKENGIYLLDNLYGDVAEKMRVRQISSRIGCGAPETITNAASQVWFCDKSGDVWSLSQVDEERMELSGEPISWPIKEYIDEKGGNSISTWSAAYHDSYFYLFFNGRRDLRDISTLYGVTQELVGGFSDWTYHINKGLNGNFRSGHIQITEGTLISSEGLTYTTSQSFYARTPFSEVNNPGVTGTMYLARLIYPNAIAQDLWPLGNWGDEKFVTLKVINGFWVAVDDDNITYSGGEFVILGEFTKTGSSGIDSFTPYTDPIFVGSQYTAVYDTINKTWGSVDYDYSQNVIGRPILMNFLNKASLLTVDYHSGNVRLIGYGEHDGTRTDRSSLPEVELLTRGYTASMGETQSFSRVNVQIDRCDNDLEIHSLVNGVNETEEFINENSSLTNRITYLNANESTGFATWNPDNSNSDFNNPYRGDYAIYPIDNTNLTGLALSTAGIATNKYQAYKYLQKINELGNYMQIKCISDAGRFKVKSISIDIRSNMNLQGERV